MMLGIPFTCQGLLMFRLSALIGAVTCPCLQLRKRQVMMALHSARLCHQQPTAPWPLVQHASSCLVLC